MIKTIIGAALACGIALAGGSTAVAGEGPSRTAAVTFADCPSNLVLTYRYYSASGTETTAVGSYSVRVAIAVRGYASVCGGLIDRVDAAARGYDDGNAAVGNVQVEDVSLYTASNPTYLRSGPSGVANSNGTANTALIYTPSRCVSPFGSGGYFSQVVLSWRYNSNVIVRYPNSSDTSLNYATISC